MLIVPLTAKSITVEPTVPRLDSFLVAENVVYPAKPLTVREIAAQYFPNDPVMLRIIEAESNFNPKAQNPHSTAAGLGQILVGTWKAYGCTGDRYDVHDNLRCTKIIYEKSGTQPWNASKAKWSI